LWRLIFDPCAGNGPSGISLSYLLSGNWPYYKGGCQDEMLHARLTAQPHLSLLEQDLEFLSDVSVYSQGSHESEEGHESLGIHCKKG
jgi:hypothetical protein